MRSSQCIHLAVILGVAQCLALHPSANPTDITSINSLPVSNGAIDPKLKRALLGVLNKIKQEENGQLPPDLPEEDFLKVIGRPAQTEDLGSFEITEDQSKNNFPYEQAKKLGRKLIDGKSDEKDISEEFNGYFLDSPTGEGSYPQTATGEGNVGPSQPEEGNYYYDPPSGSSIDYESKPQTEVSSTENSSEASTEGSTVIKNVTLVSKEPEISSVADSQTTEKPSDTTPLLSDEPSTEPVKNDAELVNEEENETSNKDNIVTSETQDSTQVKNANLIDEKQLGNDVQEDGVKVKTISRTHSYSSKYSYVPMVSDTSFLPTSPSADELDGPAPIAIPQINEEGSGTQKQEINESTTAKDSNSNEKSADVNKKTDEKVRHVVEFVSAPLITAFTVQQDDKGVPHRIIPLDYVNPTQPPAPTENPEIVAQRQREIEEKEFILQHQLRTLQQEKYRYTGVPRPNNEDILALRRQQELQEQQLLYQQQQLNNQGLQIRNSNQHFYNQHQQTSNQHGGNNQLIPKQQVQTHQSFNHQQHVQPQPQQEIQHQNHFHFHQQQPQNHDLQLQQSHQLPFLQQQYQQPQQVVIQKADALQPDAFLRQQELTHYQYSVQRQQELQREQEYHRQQELYRQQELQRQQQLERQRYIQRNQFPNQILDFQKSIDYRLPLSEHNRVHRNEPSRYVNNFGYNRPVTISGQIQALISESGISTGLPRNTQADLNIVTNILALNHGAFEHQNHQSNNVKRQTSKPPTWNNGS